MPPTAPCPRCGTARPAAALPDDCPGCLMRLGLEHPSAGGTAARAPILDTIAQSIGPVPRVLLRESTPDEVPGPIIRPADGNGTDPAIRYRIDGEIARGGMGAVLKGRDPDLGRDVALKVLRDDFRENADMVRRFVEEAQIGGQLQHPGVVPIYELGTFADRRPFFSMKLVKGQTLAALVEGRKDPQEDLPRLLGIFEQICQTVAYAHARGVIHRDLKPSNVMVGGFGEVQVMDWGLAKVLPRGGVADDARAGKEPAGETVIATARSGSDTDLSRAGSVMGTPSYMAPEQARGETGALDERCDVFALGSILTELLTGSPAFTGRSSVEIVRKAARGDVAEALSRLDSCGADPGLIAVARDCLAPEADDRPRDGHKVAGRVAAYLAGVQERLRTAEVERAAQSARAEEAEARAKAERGARRLTVALAASILALAGLGGGGYALWARQEAGRRSVAEAGVTRTLEDAIAKFGQARGSGRDPVPWAEARAAATRALDEANRAEVPDALRRRAAALLDEVDRLDKNRVIIATLIEISSSMDDRFEAGASALEIDGRYRRAFRDYGVDIARLTPQDAAARLRKLGDEVTVPLAASLDDWAWWRMYREDWATMAGKPDLAPHIKSSAEAQLRLLEADDAPRGADWLLAIARRLDPDPLRNRIRDAVARKDGAALEAIADELDPAATLPLTINNLALNLSKFGRNVAMTRLYRRAQPYFPDDFKINYNMGVNLRLPNGNLLPAAERLPYFSTAVALRPRHPLANFNLAECLEQLGRSTEAVVAYIRMAESDPSANHVLLPFGTTMEDQGHAKEAVSVYRKFLEVARRAPGKDLPAFAASRKVPSRRTLLAEESKAFREELERGPASAPRALLLGKILWCIGDRDGAIEAFLKAEASEPGMALQLGQRLFYGGPKAEAIALLREAGRRRPDLRISEFLGQALFLEANYEDALAALRDAARLAPEDSIYQYRIGETLSRLGRFGEAAEAIRRALEFEKRPEVKEEIRQALAGYERRAALAPRLPAILAATKAPKDDAERLTIFEMCFETGRYAASTRFAAEAFAGTPALGDDLKAARRYNAACLAALAGSGKGVDAPAADEARAALRRQTLGWLRADLALRAKQVDAGDPDRSEARSALQHWLQDSDLAGVRDTDALARLPEPERKEWQALWSDVDHLLKRAGETR